MSKLTKQHDETTRLGTQSITKLLFIFSLPAIASNVAWAIYNIIARIFIGRFVDEAALGGLALSLPVIMFAMGIPTLLGVGSANLISIRLGEKRKEPAEATANHCILLSIFAGVAILILGFVFIEPLLSILGAQEGSESLAYARIYISIILFGFPLQFIGLAISNIIRAQGYPTAAMIGILVHVAVNIALQYPLVYSTRLGIAGSAWALVISHAAMLVWYIVFLSIKKLTLRLTPFRFKLSLKAMGSIVIFGSSQAVAQFALGFVLVFFNERASFFGARELVSEHGGDIALSGMTIAQTISMIIVMIVFGLSTGAQPILGYNHGAGNFKRVMQTYRTAVVFASITAAAGFVLMFFFAEHLVSLFIPDGSDVLVDFSGKAVRGISIGLPVIGFQIVSANYFVATGRPKTSLFLSLLRQVILLIPVIYIAGELRGLMGVVLSGPIADILSSVVTAIVIVYVIRNRKFG